MTGKPRRYDRNALYRRIKGLQIAYGALQFGAVVDPAAGNDLTGDVDPSAGKNSEP